MKGQKSCFTTSIKKKEEIHLIEDEKRRIKQEPSLIRYAHLCVQIYILFNARHDEIMMLATLG